MPKYKDSPEVRAAKKERKTERFLQLLDVEDYSDLRSVFKEMVGEVLENGLEAELDDELGYSKYDYRNKDTENSRNGYSRKSVKTSAGPVEIAVPRDRNGEFEPQIIKKNETSLAGDIEEKILSMYAKGMTTNDISSHIEDIYGLEVSDSLVSRITDKILPVVKEWQQRPLENIYAVVFMDAIHYAELSTNFKYPQSVRTLIYTTNSIENFNRQLRKVTKSKAAFPNDDALLKMLYLAQVDITKKWTGRRRDWGGKIHSQLEVFFADRLPE